MLTGFDFYGEADVLGGKQYALEYLQSLTDLTSVYVVQKSPRVFGVFSGSSAFLIPDYEERIDASDWLETHRVKVSRFRFDCATTSVYEFSDARDAYVFCGNLNGRTKAKFVRDYDDRQHHEGIGGSQC